MGYGFASVEKTTGYSIATVEEYTLQDLGGLDTAITISGAGDGIGPAEPDFVWFGITERMKELTILFYYTFRAKQYRPIIGRNVYRNVNLIHGGLLQIKSR